MNYTTDPQHAHPDDARVAKNTSDALALRIAGASYRKIAASLGIGKSQAHRYVIDALNELHAENNETATELRRLELERLDAMMLKLWPSSATAVLTERRSDSILKIMERRAKLIGLDAPVDSRMGGLPGAPVLVSHDVDLSKLTVDELRNFLALLEIAQPPAAPALPPAT